VVTASGKCIFTSFSSTLLRYLLLIIALVPTLATAQLDRSRFIALSGALVKVEAANEDGRMQLGTGVAMGADRIVTNCHVTQRAARIHVARGGLRWRVAVQRADVERDVCVLNAPGMDAQPVAIGSTRTLKLRQPVAALGFEGGLGMQYREGTVLALHRFDGGNVVQSSTAFTSGASGGGLFDAEGKLIGLLTFRLRGADGNYFAVPVEWLGTTAAQGERDFAAVTPIADRKPFWQRTSRELPFFMQANSLEVDRKWVELLSLTERWSNADKRSPEPWFARGQAYVGLARHDAALKAFEAALGLEPENAAALLGLGMIYAREGQMDRARDVEAKLRKMNAELARQLATEIQTKREPKSAPRT
jgi:serine protease Do